MGKVISWAERFIFPPIKIIHTIANVVLFLLMILTVCDIFGRKFAGLIPFFNPVPGTFELTEYALILIIFTSIGYTQIFGEHISIDIITSRFPKRVQAILESIMLFFSMVVFALVAWQAIIYAGRLQAGHNVSGVLEIPQYPFAIVIAIGSILYCLAVLVDFLKNLARALKNESKAARPEAKAVENVA